MRAATSGFATPMPPEAWLSPNLVGKILETILEFLKVFSNLLEFLDVVLLPFLNLLIEIVEGRYPGYIDRGLCILGSLELIIVGNNKYNVIGTLINWFTCRQIGRFCYKL